MAHICCGGGGKGIERPCISFVNFERVCRPNQMTQRLEIWYMGSLYGHKLIPEISYQYSEYNFRFCGKN